MPNADSTACKSNDGCRMEPSWVVTDLAGDDYPVCYDHLQRMIQLLTPRGKSIRVHRMPLTVARTILDNGGTPARGDRSG